MKQNRHLLVRVKSIYSEVCSRGVVNLLEYNDSYIRDITGGIYLDLEGECSFAVLLFLFNVNVYVW